LPRNPNGKILKIDLRKEVNEVALKQGVAKL
jgi:hypothetical protein